MLPLEIIEERPHEIAAKVHPSEPTCDPAHHLVEQLLPAGRIYL
jgi:hypothetical protein